MAKRKKDKENQRKIASERTDILFSKIGEAVSEKDFEQADYLISLAREIGMKYNIRFPTKYKRLYCKHCYKFIQSQARSKTRVDSKNNRVEVSCLSCGKKMFFPLTS
ncbi:MAG: hypothetical protein ABH851_01000 [Methanobacteriota archaeon]